MVTDYHALKQKAERLEVLLQYWRPEIGCDQETMEAHEASQIAEEFTRHFTRLAELTRRYEDGEE